jgi:pyruvate,orthophosphate dikinase
MTLADSPSVAAPKRVYFFGKGEAEGNVTMRDLLGGKGANLADMTLAGLPVPPGFTISTQTCKDYYDGGQQLPAGLLDEVKQHLARVEKSTGKTFGDAKNPLLLACRSGSGAKDPVPGMMDTVLNIGLNDEVFEGMAALTGNPRFAYDSYRRLINMYGDTVMGVDHHHFEHELSAVKAAKGVELDTDLDADGLKEVVERYKKVYADHVGSPFPQEPIQQLSMAIEAVFKSWMGDRAIRYREINEIRGLLGTAVNVQAMVFGNMGDDCATGVAFTRDPSTGENVFYGEFLVNAQGEDVVAGIRTPHNVPGDMRSRFPVALGSLGAVAKAMEGRFKAVGELAFTIEQGRLYLLGARPVFKRFSPAAAVRIAVEMVAEGLLDERAAVSRVDREKIDQLLKPVADPTAPRECLVRGVPASPGVAVGKLAVGSRAAAERGSRGEKVVLMCDEVGPQDADAALAAEAVVTRLGGLTSHGAAHARRMGKPAVTGAGAIRLDRRSGTAEVGGRTIGPDDWVTVDGTSGEVLFGRLELSDPVPDRYLRTFLAWAEVYRPRDRLPPAYTGSEPYAFVSYSHQDRKAVNDEIGRLAGTGLRLWYDAGIQPSTAWAAEIVTALDGCAIVLLFLSREAAASPHVQREVMYAMEAKKACLPVYLEPCDLSPVIRYCLAGTQTLSRYAMQDGDYRSKLAAMLATYGVGSGDS